MIFPCLQETPEGVIVSLKVQPRASKTQLIGLYDGRLKIKLSSPPVDGAANKSCCDYLAKMFGISKSRVELITGDKARQKRILLRNVDIAFVTNILASKLKSTA